MSKTVGLLLMLSLSGCTYASTKMLNADTALISASDSEGSAKAVHQKALVTAAREAKERGYEYFAIVALNDGPQSSYELMRGSIVDNTRSPNGGWEASFSGATSNLTVRFLHANQLPASRDGIYETGAVLAR
jgi:hypothetical protein